MGETCLTFRGRNRGCDKPLLQEALEHGYGSSCETSELWSCWRAQGLLKGTLFCCRDGEAASGILPHRLPGLLRSSVDHHGLIPSTQLQVGQRLSLIDCIHHQIPLPQLPSPPVSSQHPTLLPWTLRQRTKVFVGGSSPHSRETEAQKGRWDGAGPCRLGPDLQAGYSLWPSWALGVLDSGGHARQVIGRLRLPGRAMPMTAMPVGVGGHHSQKKPALSIHGVKENARDRYLWQHLCSGARNLCGVAGLAVRQQFGPAQDRLGSETSVCLWLRGFPGGSDGKASACSAGDPGSIPGSGRPPGEGNGNPLQCSCLENSMDGGPW